MPAHHRTVTLECSLDSLYLPGGLCVSATWKIRYNTERGMLHVTKANMFGPIGQPIYSFDLSNSDATTVHQAMDKEQSRVVEQWCLDHADEIPRDDIDTTDPRQHS